jgi:hypothetical protein
MSKEIEGHVFNEVCLRCGMSRKDYDDSRKPNPCSGGGASIKLPGAPATPRADRKPRR